MSTLDKASVASLMKASTAITEAVDHLRRVVLQDTDQLDLFEEGAYSACDAFMVEREELNAALKEAQTEVLLLKSQIREELDSHRVYTQGLRSQIDRLKQELVDVSNAYHRCQEDRNTAIDTANAQAGDVKTANAVLLHIADWATQLSERFAKAGISYRADPETGEPVITYNIAKLDAFLKEAIDRS